MRDVDCALPEVEAKAAIRPAQCPRGCSGDIPTFDGRAAFCFAETNNLTIRGRGEIAALFFQR